MYVLSIHDLSKRFGKTQALDHVSLDLEQGRIYGFVGNNGAGKTTLFRCLMGLVTPDSGKISFFGASEKKALAEGRKQTGFLLPRESFSGDMSPRDNLVALQKLRGYTDRDEAMRLLEQVGITGEMARRYKLSSLSTGEFQRTAIAGTLLGDPKLLIYDEPQNGLDPSGVWEFRQLLLSLKDQGKTIFLSSHNLPELYRLATDYHFLHHGRLVQSISQAALEEQLSYSVRLTTSEPQAAAAQLRAQHVHCALEPDGTLLLQSCPYSLEKLQHILQSSGITVSSTATSGSTLEDYFLTLTQEHEP